MALDRTDLVAAAAAAAFLLLLAGESGLVEREEIARGSDLPIRCAHDARSAPLEPHRPLGRETLEGGTRDRENRDRETVGRGRSALGGPGRESRPQRTQWRTETCCNVRSTSWARP